MKSIYLTIFVCMFMQGLAYTQIDLQSFRSQKWTETHQKEKRYEGNYTTLNGKVELISLLASPPSYEFDKGQRLFVDYYVPGDMHIYLYAQEINRKSFYWMEGMEALLDMGWQSFGPWPVDQELKRLSVKHRNLGILIQGGTRAQKSFLPAWVYQDEVNRNTQRYVAYVHQPFASESMTYSVKKDSEDDSTPVLYEASRGKRHAGSSIPLFIPTEKLPDSAWYQVDVVWERKNWGEKVVYTFWFWHQAFE